MNNLQSGDSAMQSRTALFMALAGSLAMPTHAATLDQYVSACVANQANGMDQPVCTCVGNDTLAQYGQAGLDYMHARETKDSATLHKAMGSMDQQQKVSIMMHVMMAPSKCVGKVAQQQPKQPAAGQPDSASDAAAASMSASDSAAEGQ